jgi:hypothetical protein
MVDKVNHPAHYQGKVECIDVCTANAIKYLWRWKRKNGIEDLQKAHWYIEKLIGVLENDN